MTPPSPPGGLFHLPPDSVEVLDADEEIMELYMSLLAAPAREGLGFLDAREPELRLVLDLVPGQDVPEPNLTPEDPVVSPPLTGPAAVSGRRRRDRTARTTGNKGKSNATGGVSLEVTVVQDPSALRSRAGDTGSVLWRSSLHLARHILTHHHFPPPTPLLDPSALAQAHILELGAGTGILAALLARVCGRYVATDLDANLRLVRRNVDANAPEPKARARTGEEGGRRDVVREKKDEAGRRHKDSDRNDRRQARETRHDPRDSADTDAGVAHVEGLDWTDMSTARTRATARGDIYAYPPSPADAPDLVLAVDCIYNEHLVQPLVDTLAATCARGAVAWVVVELRSSDVLTHFLDTWLHDPAGWTIVRLGDGAMGTWDGEKGSWVGWVGWITGSGRVGPDAE